MTTMQRTAEQVKEDERMARRLSVAQAGRHWESDYRGGEAVKAIWWASKAPTGVINRLSANLDAALAWCE